MLFSAVILFPISIRDKMNRSVATYPIDKVPSRIPPHYVMAGSKCHKVVLWTRRELDIVDGAKNSHIGNIFIANDVFVNEGGNDIRRFQWPSGVVGEGCVEIISSPTFAQRKRFVSADA